MLRVERMNSSEDAIGLKLITIESYTVVVLQGSRHAMMYMKMSKSCDLVTELGSRESRIHCLKRCNESRSIRSIRTQHTCSSRTDIAFSTADQGLSPHEGGVIRPCFLFTLSARCRAHPSWPLTTPGTYLIVCESAIKAAGVPSISLTSKPAP